MGRPGLNKIPGPTRVPALRRQLIDVDDQPDFDPRLAWAAQGGTRLARACPVLVVVDILRFTTAVEVAVTSGAQVVPERWAGAGSPAAAGEEPGRRGFSLSPASLAGVAAGTRVVLASTGDLRLAAEHDVSRTVPRLEGGAFAQLS